MLEGLQRGAGAKLPLTSDQFYCENIMFYLDT